MLAPLSACLERELEQKLEYIGAEWIRKGTVKSVRRHYFKGDDGLLSCIEHVYIGTSDWPLDVVLARSGILSSGRSWRAPQVFGTEATEGELRSAYFEDFAKEKGFVRLARNRKEFIKAAQCLGEMSVDVESRISELGNSGTRLLKRDVGVSRKGLMMHARRFSKACGMAGISGLPQDAWRFALVLARRWEVADNSLMVACHYDANKGNVFVAPGNGLALIDWEHARRAPLGAELCQLLYSSLWGRKGRAVKEMELSMGWESDVVASYLFGSGRDGTEVYRAQFGLDFKVVIRHMLKGFADYVERFEGRIPQRDRLLVDRNLELLAEKMFRLKSYC